MSRFAPRTIVLGGAHAAAEEWPAPTAIGGGLFARLQCPFRRAGRRAGVGLRALCRPAARRRAVRPGGSGRRRRRLRLLAPPQPPDSASIPCGSTNIPTAASPSSTGPAASPASTPEENPNMPFRKPRNYSPLCRGARQGADGADQPGEVADRNGSLKPIR
jgi:hypothetical protein